MAVTGQITNSLKWAWSDVDHGVAMIPVVLSPFAERADAARLVLNISVGAFVVGEISQALRVRRGSTRVDLRAELLFRVLFFSAIVLLPLCRSVVPGATISGGAWIFFLGAVIGWTGLLLRWWSFMTLGKYFTVVLKTSEDQPVIDRGPYRMLRHPSYTGLLLAFVGCGLMYGNWIGAAGSAVLVLAGLIHRIQVEERSLDAALGDRYREYASTRARLVPFLW